MTAADHPFPFQVKPFPELVTLGEDEQPYSWEGKYGWGGVVERIVLNFGINPQGVVDGNLLAFKITAFVKPRSIVWEFASLSGMGVAFQGGDYPSRHLEPLLKKHMDPLLASILTGELEAWHLAMVKAARKSISPSDSHPSAADEARLTAWLASHSGVVKLNMRQHRRDETSDRILRAMGINGRGRLG